MSRDGSKRVLYANRLSLSHSSCKGDVCSSLSTLHTMAVTSRGSRIRPAAMSAQIELSYKLHWLASRPDVQHNTQRWIVHIMVDGKDHVFDEGPRHRVEVDPGSHEVEFFATAAARLWVAKALDVKYGRTSTTVSPFRARSRRRVSRKVA